MGWGVTLRQRIDELILRLWFLVEDSIVYKSRSFVQVPNLPMQLVVADHYAIVTSITHHQPMITLRRRKMVHEL